MKHKTIERVGMTLLIFGAINALIFVVVLVLFVWGIWPFTADPVNAIFLHGFFGIFVTAFGAALWKEYSA